MSLTSFEIILLDYIVTAVISVCTLKSLSKLVNFCVAILILKMEDNTQHFWHIMLYYFKKGKNATETQKRFVLCMEKVLRLMEGIKSGLQSFMLEIVHWTMPHG